MHITLQNLMLGTLDFVNVSSRMQKRLVPCLLGRFVRQVFETEQTVREFVQ